MTANLLFAVLVLFSAQVLGDNGSYYDIPYNNLPYCFNVSTVIGVNYEMCYGFYDQGIAVCIT